jgi:hypothetical protein
MRPMAIMVLRLIATTFTSNSDIEASGLSRYGRTGRYVPAKSVDSFRKTRIDRSPKEI